MATTSAFKNTAPVTSDADVRALQQQLNAEGANLKVDGIYGPLTDAAYKKQQSKQTTTDSMLGMAMGGGANIGAAYDAAGEQYKAAENAAYESTKTQLNDQANKLGDQYAAVRNQAYVNAKLKAIGNNEVLASLGLAGNAYAGPTSGVSETSRIAQDVGMRNDINSTNREEQSARDEIAQAIIQAGLTRDRNIAAQLAQLAIAKAGAQSSANLAGIQTALGVMQFQDSTKKNTTNSSDGGKKTNYTQGDYTSDQKAVNGTKPAALTQNDYANYWAAVKGDIKAYARQQAK